MKDRILKLLGGGYSQEVVATAVGCSPSYISQLMADENFRNEVSELRFKQLQAANSRDAAADDIEDTLLKNLKQVAPMIMRPSELTRALQIVNSLKRRGSPAEGNVHINNQIVQLQLSNVVQTRYTMNANKEIVEVEGRALVTLPTQQLLKEVKQHASNQLSGTPDSGTAHCANQEHPQQLGTRTSVATVN